MIRTQLGGKFSIEDNGLFNLRRLLINVGIDVQFPFNDKIVGEHNGIAVTFIPTPERTFFDIEIEFFNAIKDNSIHIIHNKNGDKLGYIGESASIEMAYAIIHNKPIVLLYEPVFSEKVSDDIKILVKKNIKLIYIERLDLLRKEELSISLQNIVKKSVKYDMDILLEIKIIKMIGTLLNSYRNR